MRGGQSKVLSRCDSIPTKIRSGSSTGVKLKKMPGHSSVVLWCTTTDVVQTCRIPKQLRIGTERNVFHIMRNRDETVGNVTINDQFTRKRINHMQCRTSIKGFCTRLSQHKEPHIAKMPRNNTVLIHQICNFGGQGCVTVNRCQASWDVRPSVAIKEDLSKVFDRIVRNSQ